MNKEKNNYIEFLRFLMCIVIIIHHSGFLLPDGVASILPSGHLAADFFFILTGYLSFVHVSKDEPKANTMHYSFGYTLSKIKPMFVYIVAGIVPIYLLEFLDYTSNASITDRILNLQNLFFEILLIPMSGVMRTDLLSFRAAPLWYVSVLLIALPVVIFVSIKYRDIFFNYLVFIVPALLYGYLIRSFQGISWGDVNIILYSGVIRGIADLMLGGAVYKLCEIKKGNQSKPFTIAEALVLSFVLYSFHRTIGGYDQVFVIYLCALIIFMSVGKIGKSSSLKNKLFCELGSLSMGVYCIHWMVYKYIKYFAGMINVYIGIALCIAVSLILSYLIKLFLSRGKAGQ